MTPKNVTEYAIAGQGRLFVAPTGARDIVSIEGSVLGGPNLLPKRHSIVPGVAAELLDAGTRNKSKNIIREGLAARGASLAFHASGDRTLFSASCFPEDVPYVLSLIAECLGRAAFPQAEVAAEKKRTLGNLREAKTDTRTQARIAFTQGLYDATHPNYAESLGTLELQTKALGRAEIADFSGMLGRGGLVLALAGDVNIEKVRSAAEAAFGTLGPGTETPPVKSANAKSAKASETLITIPDKANIDVFVGASVPVTKQHELYHPLYLMTEMLGGGFASHLIQTIRERDGLTYGIYANLSGFGDGTDGYFRIWATFSPELYAIGVEKLYAELRHFFAKEITQKFIGRKKEEIIGSYLVGLATTRGLASMLHSIGADGRDLSYLADFPKIIEKISLAEVRDAAKLIPLHKLSLAAAGSFPKK